MIEREQDFVFNKNLRDLRRKLGYTQAQLAEMAGVSERMVDMYETSAKKPTGANVKKIAKVLGVSDEELLGVKPAAAAKKSGEFPSGLQKKLQAVVKLSKKDQEKVFALIKDLAAKSKKKGKA